MTTIPAVIQSNSKAKIWTGWILTVVMSALMSFSAIIKLVGVPEVRQTMAHLGWPASLDLFVGVIEAVLVVLYVIPRTALIGALLQTAFLGATVAIKLRVGDPLFTHVLSGVYMAVIMWGALYLRDSRLRALFP